MRLIKPVALLAVASALLGAGAAPPETVLAEAEAKVAKAYAAAQEKLGAWAAEKKFVAEAREALQEACLWDRRSEKLARRRFPGERYRDLLSRHRDFPPRRIRPLDIGVCP